MADMDTSDLYEGGRSSKRKRGFDDDSDEEGGSGGRRNKDPDAYNSKDAKMRSDLIRSEFNKRRSAVDSPKRPFTPLTEEDKERIKNTRLRDPHYSDIASLTLKSRENWFTKMCQVMQENFDLFSNDPANSEQAKFDLCVKFEYEILEKSKNLSIYQAKCMTKYKEIRNMTAEKKSFLKDYLEKQAKLEHVPEDDEIVGDLLLGSSGKKAATAFNNLQISAGFKSASSLVKSSEAQKQSAFKKPAIENQNKIFSVPKFETKSVFDELNSKQNEIRAQVMPYEEQLSDVKVALKSEAERVREARLAKFQSAVKSEPESKLNVEDSKEPETKLNVVPKTEPQTKPDTTEQKLVQVETSRDVDSKPLGLQKISSLVVIELTPFYKANKFANKDAFKLLAKKLSHFVIEKKLSDEEEGN